MKTFLLLLIYFIIHASRVMTQPVVEWTANYIHQDNYFIATGAAIDPAGNIYIIGYSVDRDNMLIKIAQSGKVAWIRTYMNATTHSIKIDDNGNIYLGGSNNLLFFGDFWVIKYNPEGIIVWENSYSGNGFPSSDRCLDLVIDNAGYIYATGSTTVQGVWKDFCTIKYNLNGTRNWVKITDFGYDEESVSIAQDYANGIYVTGDSSYNIATIKYDINGNLLWKRVHTGEGQKILTDNANNSILTGTASTLSYNPEGSLRWDIVNIGSPNEIVVGMDQSAIITGMTLDTIKQKSFLFLSKYSNSGNLLWTNTLQGQYDYSMGKSLTVSENDNIYVTGKEGFYNEAKLLTLKYSQLGTNLWINTYSNPSDSFYNPLKIIYQNNKVYTIANLFNKDLHKYGFVVLKYGEPLGIEPINTAIPERFSLFQNYPNPFNPTTNIEFSIPSVGATRRVALTVHNLLGEEIETLFNGELKPGIYKTDWNASKYPSGIYFYKLTAGEFVQTKKMMLIK